MRSPSAPVANPEGYHERGKAGSQGGQERGQAGGQGGHQRGHGGHQRGQGGHQRGQAGKDSYYQLARDKAVLARGESSSRSSMARWEPGLVLEPPVFCQVWQVSELWAGSQGQQ